jgi:acyl carrier protein|tara:strand:- start:505 stop:777 length:273 start_codon:yes stop_codon:yes gene_type:complete
VIAKDIVFDAVNKVKQELGLLDSIDVNTKLFDNFDSMCILQLILELEDQLQKKLDRYIQIADENSMDKELTPFKSVHSLIEYVDLRINNG